jgi:hypothetical protein
MGSLQAELFVEDRAHEEFCKAIVYRLCREENRRVTLIVRSARGGHGRALTEFSLYQRALEKGLLHVPGMLIVAIDANCQRFAAMRQEISARIIPNLRDCTAAAIDGTCGKETLSEMLVFYGGSYAQQGQLIIDPEGHRIEYRRWSPSEDTSIVAYLPIPLTGLERNADEDWLYRTDDADRATAAVAHTCLM